MNKLIKLNSNIKKIIGIYLLPEFNKENKIKYLNSLLIYTSNINYYMNTTYVLSNDGTFRIPCENFTNTKYKYIPAGNHSYWTIRYN